MEVFQRSFISGQTVVIDHSKNDATSNYENNLSILYKQHNIYN